MSTMFCFFLSLIYQLLNHHVVTELMLIDVLMNNMMERISDPCCTVRMLAVRGLGNIAVGSPEKVKRSLTHEKTRPLTAKIFMRTFGHSIFLFLCSLPSPHQVNKYAKELLAAMSSGMEEKDDPGKLTAQSFFCSLALLIYCCNS